MQYDRGVDCIDEYGQEASCVNVAMNLLFP